jgi:hypothetical protein
MHQLKFDYTQLDRWDIVKQPPVPIPSGRSTKPLSAGEISTLQAAIRLGNKFNLSPVLKTMGDMIDVARGPKVVVSISPPTVSLVTPALVINMSTSNEVTFALGVAASASALFGVLGSIGFYISSTGEVGWFDTVGAGLFFNTASFSVGGELTAIAGTPTDFKGLFFGVSVGFGVGVGGTGTVLFSPTLPLGLPVVLTLMGAAFSISAVTPTKLPVTVSVEVTFTMIDKLGTV